MPLDGIAVRALARELDGLLTGGRVEKVLQPEKDEIHLIIRSNHVNHRLVLSASANHPRVLLTETSKANPLQAPMFCMLLRKKLSGALLTGIRQPAMERILEFSFGTRDELGFDEKLTLRAELMGRHSNLLLTDSEGKILDCIKHITEEKSRVRETLPGLPYEYPPAQNKADPAELTAEFLHGLVEAAPGKAVCKVVADGLAGFSLLTARSLVSEVLTDPDAPSDTLTSLDEENLLRILNEYFANLTEGELAPVLIASSAEAVPEDFAPFPMALYPAEWQKSCDTLSAAMDTYYTVRDTAERISQRTAGMVHTVRQNLIRCRKKLAKQEETLNNSENADQYRLFGELLTAFRGQVRKGQTEAELLNYYDNSTVKVPLDPSRSPMENAQQYYTRYRKAQTAASLVLAQIEENEREIAYLEEVELDLGQITTEAEVQEIREELVRTGYIRPGRLKGEKQLPPSAPLHFTSSDGFDIYVGRNNQQNDRLTLHIARKDDVWLHTQKIPGSHVIVKASAGEVSPAAIREAALLAAHFSKGSGTIPVDYTRKANVHKPAGSKPGFVLYQPFQTLLVSTEGEALEKMLQRQVKGNV